MNPQTKPTPKKPLAERSDTYCLLFSAGEWLLAYGALTGNQGAGNIIKVLAVINYIGFWILAHKLNGPHDADARPLWLKKILDLSDIAFAMAFAWFGWFWCCAAFIFGAIASIEWRARQEKK